MMGAFGIKTTVPCDFTNLSYLLILCHMWMPLLCVPLTYLLLPAERLVENIKGAGVGAPEATPRARVMENHEARDMTDNDEAPLMATSSGKVFVRWRGCCLYI